VHLSERSAWQGVLTVDSSGLREGDDEIIAEALRAVLDDARSKSRASVKDGM
jgi:hypothetical protein